LPFFSPHATLDTAPLFLYNVSIHAPVAQLDTPPAGGVQMATEQREALSHLLNIHREAAFGTSSILYRNTRQ